MQACCCDNTKFASRESMASGKADTVMRMPAGVSLRLTEALETIIQDRERDVEYWKERLREDGTTPEDSPFAECWLDMTEPWGWDQRFHEVADALLEEMARTPTLWPRLSADDIVDMATCLVANSEGESREAFRNPETLYAVLAGMVRECWQETKLRFFWIPLATGAPPESLSFSMDFPVSDDIRKDACIRRVSANVNEEGTRRRLLVRVEGVATERTGPIYVRSLLDVLMQAAWLSCLYECLPQTMRGEPILFRTYPLPMPRTAGQDWDRDCILAGAYPLPDGRTLEKEPDEFIFPRVLTSLDLKRFRWLCENVIFLPEDTRPRSTTSDSNKMSEKDERKNVIRCAIWRMAECRQLGQSPAAIIGYAAVFDEAMSALNLDFGGKPISGDLTSPANRIAEACGFSKKKAVKRALDGLFAQRNRAVHDLSYRVEGSAIRAFWRLAKAALHHLIAKGSKTESCRDKIREWQQKEGVPGLICSKESSLSCAQLRKKFEDYLRTHPTEIAEATQSDEHESDSDRRPAPTESERLAHMADIWGMHDARMAVEAILIDGSPEIHDF